METIKNLMGGTMDKIKDMVDVNAIVGDPITTPDGTTLIPVSKVTFGFLTGGSDGEGLRFGAGSSAGVSVSPVAFISIYQGNVRMIYIEPPANTTIDKIVDMAPPIIDKITNMVKDKKEPKEPEY